MTNATSKIFADKSQREERVQLYGGSTDSMNTNNGIVANDEEPIGERYVRAAIMFTISNGVVHV